MNEILKKIDEEIEREQKHGGHFVFDKGSVLFGMVKIREIIQAEQKEHDGCKNCKYEEKTEDDYPCNICKSAYTDEYEIKTKGDVIRESNENLADYVKTFTVLADKQRILDYLNQPVESEK